jgi:DNA-binding transcriptional LysR family regulator
MTPVVAAAVMTKAFREFERIAPDVQIALVEGLPSIAIPALIEGRIDFAFAIANSKELPFELSFRELAKIETAIGCRKGHPLESAKRWSELQDARWALNLSAGSQGNQLLRWMRERGMGEPRRLTYCDSPLLMSDLMRRADRLCVGPKTLFSDPIFGHQMSLIAVEPAPPDMVLGVITLKGVPLTHAASQLLSCFERHLRGIR